MIVMPDHLLSGKLKVILLSGYPDNDQYLEIQ